MGQASLHDNSVIPISTREENIRELSVSPKTRKRIENAMATLEMNVRWFLEAHCDIRGAQDLTLPRETLKLRMELMNVQVAHVRVAEKPQLNGVWIIKSGKPQVSFTDPVLKDGWPQIKMINLAPAAIVTSAHILSAGNGKGKAST
jgi:hypothetical protein